MVKWCEFELIMGSIQSISLIIMQTKSHTKGFVYATGRCFDKRGQLHFVHTSVPVDTGDS